MELLGKVRDRSVGTPELLQNAASSGIRERGERGIEAGPRILNRFSMARELATARGVNFQWSWSSGTVAGRHAAS